MKGVFIVLCLLVYIGYAGCSTAENSFTENVKRVFLYGYVPTLIASDPSRCVHTCVSSHKYDTLWSALCILMRVHAGWALPFAALPCEFECCDTLLIGQSSVHPDTDKCAEATRAYKEAVVTLSGMLPRIVITLTLGAILGVLVFCISLCCGK